MDPKSGLKFEAVGHFKFGQLGIIPAQDQDSGQNHRKYELIKPTPSAAKGAS
jgi:hypothetical protein